MAKIHHVELFTCFYCTCYTAMGYFSPVAEAKLNILWHLWNFLTYWCKYAEMCRRMHENMYNFEQISSLSFYETGHLTIGPASWKIGMTDRAASQTRPRVPEHRWQSRNCHWGWSGRSHSPHFATTYNEDETTMWKQYWSNIDRSFLQNWVI